MVLMQICVPSLLVYAWSNVGSVRTVGRVDFPDAIRCVVFSKPSADINAVFRCWRDTHIIEIAVAESGVYTCCTVIYQMLSSIKISLALTFLLFGIAIAMLSLRSIMYYVIHVRYVFPPYC